MLPDRVSNPGPLTYESGALPIALRGPARLFVCMHVYVQVCMSARLVCTFFVCIHVCFILACIRECLCAYKIVYLSFYSVVYPPVCIYTFLCTFLSV